MSHAKQVVISLKQCK